MAIPTGSGTEVLRSGMWNTQSTDVTSFDFSAGNPTLGDETDTVPANHIITMLSIIWCETANAAEVFHLNDNSGYILVSQPLSARGTFIWAERYVVPAGGMLQTLTGTSADVDVYYSYLDQDWS